VTAGQLPCYSFSQQQVRGRREGKDKLKERGERRAVVVVSRTESQPVRLAACLPLGETIHTKLLEGEAGGGEEEEEEERMLNYYFSIEDFSKSGPLKEKNELLLLFTFTKREQIEQPKGKKMLPMMIAAAAAANLCSSFLSIVCVSV